MGENLFNDDWVFDTYMDPSRFARHNVVRDKKKVATIYPACLCELTVAGLDEFRSS